MPNIATFDHGTYIYIYVNIYHPKNLLSRYFDLQNNTGTQNTETSGGTYVDV